MRKAQTSTNTVAIKPTKKATKTINTKQANTISMDLTAITNITNPTTLKKHTISMGRAANMTTVITMRLIATILSTIITLNLANSPLKNWLNSKLKNR